MAYYAKIDNNNKVVRTLVADTSFFTNFIDDSPGEWLVSDASTGVGYIYSIETSLYTPPEPWVAPLAAPDDGNQYVWNESTLEWVNGNEIHTAWKETI